MAFQDWINGSDGEFFVSSDSFRQDHGSLFESSQPESFQKLIDPRLSPPDLRPLDRYLSEPNAKPWFHSPSPPASQHIGFSSPHSNVSPFPPPTSAGRQTSPFSNILSPSSSGAQSPPTESDMCYEGAQGPHTPPEFTYIPPTMNHMPSEGFQGTSGHDPLARLRGSQGFVSLCDVLPSQNMLPTAAGTQIEAIGTLAFPHASMGASQNHLPYDQSAFALSSMPQQFDYGMGSSSGDMVVAPEFRGNSAEEYDSSHVMQQITEEPIRDAAGLLEVREDLHGDDTQLSETPARQKRKTAACDARVSKGKQSSKKKTGTASSRSLSLSANASLAHICKTCDKTFKDVTLLQKHERADHTRPFKCIFHYAGCSATFGAKNEWKRHVITQHLSLDYWLCTAESCAKTTGPSTQKRSASLPTHGAIFNRKDLYTQHVRRMHAPSNVRKAMKHKKPAPAEWEARLKRMQQDATKKRITLPAYMECPAHGCMTKFQGASAWDDRMEHVARHLEQAAAGKGSDVYFGGLNDPTLTQWAEADGVDVVKRTGPTSWECLNVLKDQGAARKTNTTVMLMDEDADGEEY